MTRWAPPELISAALTGEEHSVEQLIAAVWPACFRLAASVIGDRSLAQDAAQEACAIVHRKVRALRSPDSFDAWLYRIVMREAARVRRRRGAIAEQTLEGSVSHDGTTSLDVWRALALLSPDLRDVTVLFYFDDLPTERIAAILHVAQPTVRTRLARARERLRGLLGDYGGEPTTTREETNQHAF